MTSKKHFKALVRERMTRTGETYTTARRHILARGTQPRSEGAAPSHLAGNIPATTALRVLLNHASLDSPLSEAMVFGMAGSIGMGVFQFYYEKEDLGSFFLAGRHSWHDDLPYATGLLESLGARARTWETGGKAAAAKDLREALDAGAPCIAWVDAASLPGRAGSTTYPGGTYHVVTVYSIDEETGTALIGDCADRPEEISLDDLAASRARIKKQKNRLLTVGDAPQLDPDKIREAAFAGLARGRNALLNPPMKSAAANFKLEALEAWAKRLESTGRKDSWDRVFRPGANLWTALTWTYDCIEHLGTGGGLCRYYMAEFLDELGKNTDRKDLKEIGSRYRKLGEAWTELARAALPDSAPLLKEARELLASKAELIHDAAGSEDLAAVAARLERLAEQASEAFPLDESECSDLYADLASRVRSIHADEVAGLEHLRDVIE